jgi:parallel beta-helix repeat protein
MKATAIALGVVAMAAGPFVGMATAQAAPAPHTVTVSQHGSSHGKHHGTVFSSIGKAVAAVAPGGRVIVDGGTYHEDVAVTKTLTLEGTHHATIDAANLINGVMVTANHVTVSGLTVEHATGEGILVQNAEHTTVKGNTVTKNDLGVALKNPVKNTYAFCQPQGGMANDCGENIHLVGSSHNTVRDNVVTDGSGGVLVTDETGPSSHNTISGNTIVNNSTACGVVLGGHNGNAAPGGKPAPTVAGVFDNLVKGNRITGSGLKSTGGGGVQMSTGLPGGAVYNNTVKFNHIYNNGHSGITVHSHAPGQYLNGDVVTDNIFGTNNLNGDHDFANQDDQTTGVFVGSVTPLSITVKNNRIEDNKVGIFTSGPVTVTGQQHNVFRHVDTPVSNNA